MSIRNRVVIAVLACLAIATAGVLQAVDYVSRRDVEVVARQSVRNAARTFANLEQGDVDKLSTALLGLAANRALVDAYLERDRARLYELARPVFAEMRDRHSVTHWYFLDGDPDRRCFLRVHVPDLYGDVVSRATLAQAIARHDVAAGKEIGKTAFALRVVSPWVADGRVIGYLELGEEIDHFLARMKQQTGDEFGLLLDKRFISEKDWAESRRGRRNGWGDHEKVLVVDSTTPDETLFDFEGTVEGVPAHGQVLETERRGDRTYVRGLFPVKDATGAMAGAVFVLHDVTPMLATMARQRARVLAILAVLAIAVSALLVVLLQRLVFRRLTAMTSRLEDLSERVAGGDYDVARAVATARDDELGRFEAFFGRFLAVVASALKTLEESARKRG